MKKLLLCVLAAASLFAAPPKKPKLVLAIVVDQFRYDYLTRFRADYTAGFNRLLTQGAVFTNARYIHFPTVTAMGHSTFLSGATPSISGIVGNLWFDRDLGKQVTSVTDDNGPSPHHLLVSTVGDELKIATGGKAKVVGVSLKDRSAILPAGRMADSAWWFDVASGNFTTSPYYGKTIPDWADAYGRSRPADKLAGQSWLGHVLPAEPAKLFLELEYSPLGNDLVETMAEKAIAGEQMGKDDITDLLAVSFSANDYAGHRWGPDSPEVKDISIRTDLVIGKLIQYAESQAGAGNVLVVMTSDHGVAPMPEVQAARKMPGGRVPGGFIRDTAQKALLARYGEGNWIQSQVEHSLYLNLELLAQKRVDAGEAIRVAAAALRAAPFVLRVYSREQILGGASGDLPGTLALNGFHPRRSGDLVVELAPYWVLDGGGAGHGEVFSYDTHVPVIFMGAGIKAGRYYQQIAPNDIAPTLAQILDIETPSGSVGRVLYEMFAQ